MSKVRNAEVSDTTDDEERTKVCNIKLLKTENIKLLPCLKIILKPHPGV